MATAAQLAAKVARGYGIAAAHLGDTCNWYRCNNSGPVIIPGNLLGTLPASFSPDGKYQKNEAAGKNDWVALVDATQVQRSDYLVDPNNVAWFILKLREFLPPAAVQCNHVITLKRPAAPASVGLGGYGGDIAGQEQTLATGWPASVLSATRRGEHTDAKLPSDENGEWWSVLLPAIPGVTINLFDIITDDIGRRAVISTAELTPENGWRLTAAQQVT